MTVSKDDFAHRSGAAAGLFAGGLLFTCRSDAVLYHLVMSDGMLARTDDLISVHEAGYDEIDDSLCPQCTDFGQNVIDSPSHGRYPQVATYTESGRDEPAEALPYTGNVALRP